VTQRRRNEIKENLLDPSGHGDLDFPYDELEQVELLGNRIQLRLKDRIVRIAVSRKYSRMLGPLLQKIIPAKIQSEPIPSERAP